VPAHHDGALSDNPTTPPVASTVRTTDTAMSPPGDGRPSRPRRRRLGPRAVRTTRDGLRVIRL
jgi:hypothetical protein